MSKKSRFTEEQIIRALKEVDAGAKVDEVCRRLGVTQTTFYRWKSKFGGMEVSEAKRLKTLEDQEQPAEAVAGRRHAGQCGVEDLLGKKW